MGAQTDRMIRFQTEQSKEEREKKGESATRLMASEIFNQRVL